MDKQTIDELKLRLESDQERLSDLVERTAKHLYKRDEPYSADFAEQAIEVSNNEVVEHLDEDAKLELKQIAVALRRIEQGQYGICESCAEEINEQRLKAIPHAALCIKCAEAN